VPPGWRSEVIKSASIDEMQGGSTLVALQWSAPERLRLRFGVGSGSYNIPVINFIIPFATPFRSSTSTSCSEWWYASLVDAQQARQARTEPQTQPQAWPAPGAPAGASAGARARGARGSRGARRARRRGATATPATGGRGR
jgi:hypothetical protein